MPTFRFHAVDADASAILDFVFRELRCRVVDAYSRYDAPIAEYQDSASALAAYPAPPSSAARFIHLKVWRPDFGGEIRVRKIDFRPGAVPGHSFWHVSEGWGLIDLQIARRHIRHWAFPASPSIARPERACGKTRSALNWARRSRGIGLSWKAPRDVFNTTLGNASRSASITVDRSCREHTPLAALVSHWRRTNEELQL